MRIIVVDDNEDNRIILKKMLQKVGHMVLEAQNGQEALGLIRASVPDMIISDILMPVMDGFQLCRLVKGDNLLNRILFVFYTATYTDSKDEELSLTLGAEQFIRKPMDPEAFIERLREVVEQHQAGQLEVERKAVTEETVYLKLYNETLIRKLEDKLEQLEGVNQALAQDISERKLAEKKLKASLREKDILISEIHHRVKNNLQVISGLLNLQARASQTPEVIEGFRKSQDRIRSMAMVHEKLYNSKDFSEIDLAGYVRSLSEDLFRTHNIHSEKIDLTIQTEGAVFVDISKAIPCGLILNELTSNALKHAFPGDRQGELQIILRETKNREIEIIVRDNGLGLPDHVDIHEPRSVGLHLVNGLVKNQLNGQLEVGRDKGTEFRITFPYDILGRRR